jgi:hypothetical protein
MFLSDALLLNDLADTLQKEQGTLQPFYGSILSQEHAKAYNWLVSALLKRGFLLSQIVAWDMGPYYERDLTLYQTLRRTAALQAVDDRLLLTLDSRKEVEGMECLAIAGVFQTPAGTAGQVGIGDMDTSDDIFVLGPSNPGFRDSAGGNRGDPTNW